MTEPRNRKSDSRPRPVRALTRVPTLTLGARVVLVEAVSDCLLGLGDAREDRAPNELHRDFGEQEFDEIRVAATASRPQRLPPSRYCFRTCKLSNVSCESLSSSAELSSPVPLVVEAGRRSAMRSSSSAMSCAKRTSLGSVCDIQSRIGQSTAIRIDRRQWRRRCQRPKESLGAARPRAG